jgi:hypothetical protein
VLQGVHTGHPQDIQASGISHHNQHNRHKLRQKALVDSVESKV